jgi:hypothetical protein
MISTPLRAARVKKHSKLPLPPATARARSVTGPDRDRTTATEACVLVLDCQPTHLRNRVKPRPTRRRDGSSRPCRTREGHGDRSPVGGRTRTVADRLVVWSAVCVSPCQHACTFRLAGHVAFRVRCASLFLAAEYRDSAAPHARSVRDGAGVNRVMA